MIRAPDLNTKNFVEIVIHITSTLRLRSVTLCVEGDAFMLKPFMTFTREFYHLRRCREFRCKFNCYEIVFFIRKNVLTLFISGVFKHFVRFSS